MSYNGWKVSVPRYNHKDTQINHYWQVTGTFLVRIILLIKIVTIFLTNMILKMINLLKQWNTDCPTNPTIIINRIQYTMKEIQQKEMSLVVQ